MGDRALACFWKGGFSVIASSSQQIRFLMILLLGSPDAPIGKNERRLILLLSTIQEWLSDHPCLD